MLSGEECKPINFKVNHDAHTIFGCPNVLVRNNPKFQEYSEREDKNLLELFQRTNLRQQMEIHKYFDRILKEEDLNEYNVTEVSEREIGKAKLANFFKKGAIEVINKLDSTLRTKCYPNMVKRYNIDRIKQTMNGMQSLNDLCFLQVRGQNQLSKEVEELKSLTHKNIDFTALHRNEITHEIEGFEENSNADEMAHIEIGCQRSVLSNKSKADRNDSTSSQTLMSSFGQSKTVLSKRLGK